MCSNIPSSCDKCYAYSHCTSNPNDPTCSSAPGICASCWGLAGCDQATYSALPAATVTWNVYTNPTCIGTPTASQDIVEDTCTAPNDAITATYSITTPTQIVVTATGYSCAYEGDASFCNSQKDLPHGTESDCSLNPINLCVEQARTARPLATVYCGWPAVLSRHRLVPRMQCGQCRWHVSLTAVGGA